MAENTDVVVIGGYAGVMAADRLTQRGDMTVTLVDPRPTFVHGVRPHRLVGGTGSAAVGYQEVLAEGVRPVVDGVTRIDAVGRGAEPASGGAVGCCGCRVAREPGRGGTGLTVCICPRPTATSRSPRATCMIRRSKAFRAGRCLRRSGGRPGRRGGGTSPVVQRSEANRTNRPQPSRPTARAGRATSLESRTWTARSAIATSTQSSPWLPL